MKKLLIDAISTSSGGAINHLKNILIDSNKQKYFSTIDVYLPPATRKLMPVIKNVNYISPKIFSKNLLLRIIWQILFLNIIIFKNKYNCIFVTGSSHLIISKPVVTISQNLLPFSSKEVKKYFFSFFYIKLKILFFTQKISFKFSEGVIFLHKYSRNFILRRIGGIKGLNKIIAHGVKKFDKNRKYNKKKYRLIYVSNIDYYKNHLFLVKCIDEFMKNNPYYEKNLKVEFYGSNYPPALKKLNNLINNEIKYKKNFRYYGVKDSKLIYKERKSYDTIFLFASSCENFAVSLIEGMSRGFPILCVNLEPMKSVLGNSAIFYNFNSKTNFQLKLKKILNSKFTQNELSKKVSLRSKEFGDQIASEKTFNFLIKIAKKYEK